MRFVPVKSLEQQSALLLHRTRDLLVAQRTQLANALRGHLAEFGVVAAKGLGRVRELITLLAEAHDDRVPPLAREVLMAVVAQLRDVEQKIAELERQLLAWHRTNEVSQRPGSRPARGQRKGRTGLALEPEATEDLLELARAIEHLMAYRSDRDRLKPVQFRAQRSA